MNKPINLEEQIKNKLREQKNTSMAATRLTLTYLLCFGQLFLKIVYIPTSSHTK
jgi:hypothetical protein